eukprot:2307310-Rhodomonas_salina.1
MPSTANAHARNRIPAWGDARLRSAAAARRSATSGGRCAPSPAFGPSGGPESTGECERYTVRGNDGVLLATARY